jgi:hypothetical protein
VAHLRCVHASSSKESLCPTIRNSSDALNTTGKPPDFV